MISYSVKVFDIFEVPSTKDGGEPSWRLRWKVKGRKNRCSQNFATLTAADSFRSDLIAARNAGEPFDVETGLPLSMLRRQRQAEAKPAKSHFEHARDYAAMKWPDLSGRSRETTAFVLTAITSVLVSDQPRRPADSDIWRVLYKYTFQPARWPDDERPRRVKAPRGSMELTSRDQIALDWISRASIAADQLKQASMTRKALSILKEARRREGDVTAVTFRRRRGVLSNYYSYLIEEGVLEYNPLDKVKRTEKQLAKSVAPVDKEVAFGPEVALELLTALTYVGSYKRARGRRLVVFFALIMFGALRNEEALGLRIGDCQLPESGWGRLTLRKTKPTAGKDWTDTGDIHDDRGLKGRDEDEDRPVPIPPILVRILQAHIREFGVAADGRIVQNERGGIPVNSTLSRAWKEARELALTPDQVKSKLAETPYTGRHSAVSMHLSAGMDPADIAERAGNSVEVLLRIYAKFVLGREETNNKKVDSVLSVVSDGDIDLL